MLHASEKKNIIWDEQNISKKKKGLLNQNAILSETENYKSSSFWFASLEWAYFVVRKNDFSFREPKAKSQHTHTHSRMRIYSDRSQINSRIYIYYDFLDVNQNVDSSSSGDAETEHELLFLFALNCYSYKSSLHTSSCVSRVCVLFVRVMWPFVISWDDDTRKMCLLCGYWWVCSTVRVISYEV